jgi:Ni,Fe-hydrogenase III small subunit/ferredoxin
MPWFTRGLRNGVVTTRWPRRGDEYEASWPGAVDVRDQAAVGEEPASLAELCPTDAIRAEDATLRIDRGRCILCGRCVQARPDVFTWASGARTAAVRREALVVPSLPETDEALADARRSLAERTSMLRRSVHIRHVDVGSDGADEWEVLALLNPVYDVHRLGIFFTASPRHADILLLTGVGSTGMIAPLARTIEATAQPVAVIAAGVDAISGGVVHPTYATSGGVGGLAPVDVWVPGSPPSPFSLLHGILLAVGRLS